MYIYMCKFELAKLVFPVSFIDGYNDAHHFMRLYPKLIKPFEVSESKEIKY